MSLENVINLVNTKRKKLVLVTVSLIAFGLMLSSLNVPDEQKAFAGANGFQLEEATISDIHQAIQAGDITCVDLVQGYIDRAAAYNNVCTSLITADGASIPATTGYVRAGAPTIFPTDTVIASSIFPDLVDYVGLPLDLGRMEFTISDPTVEQQFGMRVGIPDVGQLNALETINIRGERSVTCRAECDAAPGPGMKKLPKTCPAVCNDFRQQPDALERAAELDAEFGTNPDLDNLPMYCITFAFKDPIDTTDMRTTANADVAYAMDASPFDSTIVDQLRAKGAIIYAKAQATEYNFGPGNPGGAAVLTKNFFGDQSLSTWSGEACNPYDTERSTAASSSGSGVAVSANLVACAFCEQSFGSCKGPAGKNGVVSILTTNNIIQGAGGFPNEFITDRLGIMCRTVDDAAQVLDALRDPEQDYFDSGDIYTALPKSLISEEPYASFVIDDVEDKPLEGIRIGIVREFMTEFIPNEAAINELIEDEIKDILRDELGAELVESVDPLANDDKKIPNMEYTFDDAIAEILPRHMPEFFSKRTFAGALEFAVPGFDVESYDYLLQLSTGQAPLSDDLNLRRLQHSILQPNTLTVKFGIEQYFIERDDATVKDWESLFANSKWNRDELRRNHENWLNTDERVSAGLDEQLKLRNVLNLIILKVMHENDIDVLVNPENSFPAAKIGGAEAGRGPGFFIFFDGGTYPRITATAGLPEIIVTAGSTQIVFESEFALSGDKTTYNQIAGTVESTLPNPMPFSIMFWAGPGDESTLIEVASAYEAATQHRFAPPDFPPLG